METHKDIAVILVAGGQGSRMGSSLPKQFLQIGEKPILIYTLEVFRRCMPQALVLIVMHQDYIAHTESLIASHNLFDKLMIVAGGNTRFHSVQNALAQVPEAFRLVMVHDAVRPLVTDKMLDEGISACKGGRGAIPVVAIKDSLRRLETGQSSFPLDRSQIVAVQTPQIFPLDRLKEAYKQTYQDSFTDDAAVFEKAGFAVNLYEGDRLNLKITFQEDIDFVNYVFHSGKIM